LVFGPERTGLENEDIVHCDTVVAIPTAPENPSLNLAQAAVILGYEWWQAAGEPTASGSRKKTQYGGKTTGKLPTPAPKEDYLGLFGQLEEYLDASDYFRVAHKKQVMWLNLKNMLLRGGWSAQEVRSFRGMIRSLWQGKRG
jgi:tRNA/rRNA methyltransferase